VALLQLKEVSLKYKNNVVLSDVNLSVEEGDILGVIGQSGSGKTSLLNLLAGFIEPTDGEVVYFTRTTKEERDLNENLSKIKRQVGYTPQHNSFYPKLTVRENLWHFGRLYNVPKPMLKNNIQNLLNFTQLIDHQHKIAEQLSGGMQKRLDITCSLIHKPKILILDEPTADLDPILQKEILHLLKEVNAQGMTIIIASHHLDGIEHLCNKVAIIHKKSVHSHGLMDDVKRPYFHDHFTITVRPGEQKGRLLEKLKKFPVIKIIDRGNSIVVYPQNVEDTMSKIIGIIKQENFAFNDMQLTTPLLSDVFEQIILARD